MRNDKTGCSNTCHMIDDVIAILMKSYDSEVPVSSEEYYAAEKALEEVRSINKELRSTANTNIDMVEDLECEIKWLKQQIRELEQ